MRCDRCGTENPVEGGVCSNCGAVLIAPSGLGARSGKVRSVPIWLVAVIVAIVVILVFGGLALTMPDLFGSPEDIGNGSSDEAVLIVTLVNPAGWAAEDWFFELYVNGEAVANGTVPIAGSVKVERNFTVTGQSMSALIHVEVSGALTPTRDRTVTLYPGQIEEIAIVLNS